MSIREGRGKWTMLDFGLDSAATIKQGDLVGLDPQGEVRRWSSVQSTALGIAMHDSANSLPPGRIIVKVPNSPDCTAWGRTATNVAASSLSAGQPCGVTSDATYADLLAFGVSATSRLGVMTGRYQLSPVSEAEFIPNTILWSYGAASAVTLLS